MMAGNERQRFAVHAEPIEAPDHVVVAIDGRGDWEFTPDEAEAFAEALRRVAVGVRIREAAWMASTETELAVRAEYEGS